MGVWQHITFVCSIKGSEFKGKTITYKAARNPLTGSWCYVWSYSTTMWIAPSLQSIKTVVKNIRKREKIIEDTFDFKKLVKIS